MTVKEFGMFYRSCVTKLPMHEIIGTYQFGMLSFREENIFENFL